MLTVAADLLKGREGGGEQEGGGEPAMPFSEAAQSHDERDHDVGLHTG